MASLSPITATPDLTEQVYQRLLYAICDGKLAPTIIHEGRRAAAGQCIGSMIDADMHFHHLIYAASGNPLIAETATHHWPHIRRAMGAVLHTVGLRRPVWDEHAAIVQAINGGDADEAERLAREHCARASDHIATQLTRHGRPLPERLAWQAAPP